MNQPQSQDQNPLGSDETQALLAFNTNLLEQTIPQEQGPEGQETPESGQQGQENQEPQQDPMTEMMTLKDEIMSELQKVREDIKLVSKGDSKDERSEVEDLKKEIEKVLKDQLGVKKTTIEVTFDPPYKMPEELRTMLGI